TAAVKAALELDLFSAIGESGATAAELATRCDATVRGIRILCDYLTVLGFLEKKAPSVMSSTVETSSDHRRYHLTRDSATFLNKNSPAYAGGAAEFLLSDHLTEGFANVAGAVRKGGTMLGGAGSMAPEHPMWLSFARGMSWLMMPGAQALAQIVALDPARDTKVLDISASH